ncbi:MAG: hypothetical protein AAFV95_05290 [Bacteroidota bacterium]
MKNNQWIQILKKGRDALILMGVEGSKPLYGRLFRRHRRPWSFCRQQLLAMPKGSLGQALGQFLRREQLELMPKFETHDVMHVLLDYPTTVADEVRMQCFLTGNGKRSSYCLLAIATGVLLMPEHWKSFREAYRRGKAALPCHAWDFQYLLREPLQLLQKKLYKKHLGVEAPFYC